MKADPWSKPTGIATAKPMQHALHENDHDDLKHFELLELDSKFVINSGATLPHVSRSKYALGQDATVLVHQSNLEGFLAGLGKTENLMIVVNALSNQQVAKHGAKKLQLVIRDKGSLKTILN